MITSEEFAKELAKQLPMEAMYKDAVSPAAKQLGQFAEDLLKVLQLDRIPVRFEHHLSGSGAGLSRPPRLYLLCAFKFEVAGTSPATTP